MRRSSAASRVLSGKTGPGPDHPSYPAPVPCPLPPAAYHLQLSTAPRPSQPPRTLLAWPRKRRQWTTNRSIKLVPRRVPARSWRRPNQESLACPAPSVSLAIRPCPDALYRGFATGRSLYGPNPMKTHLIQFFPESPVTRLWPPATADFYSLHERQSLFANLLKTKDKCNFYSLQNRPFLKKRRTPDQGVRPDPAGTNVLPDQGVRPPHGFGGRTASPSRAFIPLAPKLRIGNLIAERPALESGAPSRAAAHRPARA